MTVSDGQEGLREALKDVDWSVISFSSCQNCGKAIYHGPRTASGKDDDTAKVVVWRHVATQSNQCNPTTAVPIP
jgi:hypothetical protein